MSQASTPPQLSLVPPDATHVDHRMLLHGVSWDQYEALLASRGERGGNRMTYLRGALEIMSPSYEHEAIKKTWARLLEAYAEETGVELVGCGSWTVRSEPDERGLEPGECYTIGVREVAAPDLALEVIWTTGLLDKMDVYRGLGVLEVWVWRDGRIEVNVLRSDRPRRDRGTPRPRRSNDRGARISRLTAPNLTRSLGRRVGVSSERSLRPG